MRKLALVVIIASSAVIIWLPFRNPAIHRMNLTTYFRNGAGLRAGATVRVDGVDLGSVTSVRVRPELGEQPVEVRIAIASPYDLVIPNDSSVMLKTEGVLGATLLDIDTRQAHGAPIGTNGVLKSQEPTPTESAEVMNRFKAVIQTVNKAFPERTTSPTNPADSGRK